MEDEMALILVIVDENEELDNNYIGKVGIIIYSFVFLVQLCHQFPITYQPIGYQR